MKKTVLLFSLFSSLAVAQDTIIFDQNINLTSTVSSVCNIRSGTTFFTFSRIYYNEPISVSDAYQLDCVIGAIVNIKIGLGGNPQSTASVRRLPLAGEAGDVEHYLTYQLLIDNEILDDKVGITRQFLSAWSSSRNINVNFSSPKEQPNLAIGKYTENLPVYFDYY